MNFVIGSACVLAVLGVAASLRRKDSYVPLVVVLVAMGTISILSLIPMPDTRGCIGPGLLTPEIAQGIVKCPQPKTTTYGFNRPVREVK